MKMKKKNSKNLFFASALTAALGMVETSSQLEATTFAAKTEEPLMFACTPDCCNSCCSSCPCPPHEENKRYKERAKRSTYHQKKA